MTDPLVQVITEKLRDVSRLKVVRVECTSTTPFQVLVNGQGPIDAKRINGQTFSVGEVGYGLWQAPLPPICFKVT